MSQSDTASRADLAAAALADLFDEEIRAMGDAGIADIECRALELGHKAMAAALGRALERYDLRLCSSLPEGAGVHDRRGRTLATKMGGVMNLIRIQEAGRTPPPRARPVRGRRRQGPRVDRARLRASSSRQDGWRGRRDTVCCRRRRRHGRHQRVGTATINFTPSRGP